MKLFKRIFELYLKSSTHVALAVVAFAGVTILSQPRVGYAFTLANGYDLLLFIFFGTVTAYNFIKYASIAKFNHLTLTKNLRIIQLFSLLCFIGLVYFGWQQPWSILIASGIFGIISLLYVWPVLPNNKNLRSVSGLKIFVIALVWAGVTVILPILTRDVIYLYETILTFIQRCLLVIVLTLPFDIRDLRFDKAQLGTIPQVFGVEKTRQAGVLCLSLAVILEIFKPVVVFAELVALIIIVTITYFFIRRSVARQTKYFASFWVEGIPILWWLLLYGLTALS